MIDIFNVNTCMACQYNYVKRKENLDLNRMIKHFSNFKNMFTPLDKESQLILIEQSSSYIQENVKSKKSNHELGKMKEKKELGNCLVPMKHNLVDLYHIPS